MMASQSQKVYKEGDVGVELLDNECRFHLRRWWDGYSMCSSAPCGVTRFSRIDYLMQWDWKPAGDHLLYSTCSAHSLCSKYMKSMRKRAPRRVAFAWIMFHRSIWAIWNHFLCILIWGVRIMMADCTYIIGTPSETFSYYSNCFTLVKQLHVCLLGCPKKNKSLNFVTQLTPVVFIG